MIYYYHPQNYLLADDTNIFYEAENLFQLQRVIDKGLKKVKKWLDVNKLSLNIDKTNYIILKSPQHSSSESVSTKIGSLPVKRTASVKFLGILLKTVSWKYQLTELSKKLARTCGIFFKVRHFFPINVLICLFNSLFPLSFSMVF